MARSCGAADHQVRPSPLLRCKLLLVVDWISLDVRLPSPSQHRHVMDALANSGLHVTFAEPLGATNSSRTSDSFRLRVQDPAGPDVVLQGLQRSLKIGENSIKVHGLEVALDAYVPADNNDDLVTVASHMLWATATPPPGQVWITGKGKRNSRPAKKPAELRGHLGGPYSANIGKEDADRMGMRAYVKRTDSPMDAPPATPRTDLEHPRARLERWFLNTAVPFDCPTLAGWRAYKFTNLTKHFAQVRIDPAAGGTRRAILAHQTIQLGQPDDDKARRNNQSLSRPDVLRDSDTNEAIRVSLRRLTSSQRRGKPLKI